CGWMPSIGSTHSLRLSAHAPEVSAFPRRSGTHEGNAARGTRVEWDSPRALQPSRARAKHLRDLRGPAFNRRVRYPETMSSRLTVLSTSGAFAGLLLAAGCVPPGGPEPEFADQYPSQELQQQPQGAYPFAPGQLPPGQLPPGQMPPG